MVDDGTDYFDVRVQQLKDFLHGVENLCRRRGELTLEEIRSMAVAQDIWHWGLFGLLQGDGFKIDLVRGNMVYEGEVQ